MNDNYKINLCELESEIILLGKIDNIKYLSKIVDLVRIFEKSKDPLSFFSGIISADLNTRNFRNLFLSKQKLFTRIITIISHVIIKLDVKDEESFRLMNEIISLKKTLSCLFGASIYENSDYFLLSLLEGLKDKDSNFRINSFSLMKISCLYCMSSSIQISRISNIYKGNNNFFIQLCFSLLSEVTIFEDSAKKNKDWILNKIPEMLDEVKTYKPFSNLYLNFFDAYFYCTYSSDKNRHLIKKSIHEFLRRCRYSKELEVISKNNILRLNDNKLSNSKSFNNKILIIHENFSFGHAMFRSYSKFLKTISKNNELIGLCFNPSFIDEKSKLEFDTHYVIEENHIQKSIYRLSEIINSNEIDIIFYPSIGMSLETIISSSYRLASRQIAALGHPAPILSNTLDLVIAYEGIADSEMEPNAKTVLLNRTHPMHFPSLGINVSDQWNIFKSHQIADDKPVKIAITATKQKITSEFLEIVLSLSNTYTNSIEFIFHDATNSFMANEYLNNFLKARIQSKFEIIPTTFYQQYLTNLASCAICMSPFPFGNHSGFFDCSYAGLLGPCIKGKTHPQNMERKYYELAGLNNLIANDPSEYFNIVSDLILFCKSTNTTTDVLPKKIMSPFEVVAALTESNKEYCNMLINSFC